MVPDPGLPFGVACLSVQHARHGRGLGGDFRAGCDRLLLQLWDLPWLVLHLPIVGPRYRRWLVRTILARVPPDYRCAVVEVVRLGRGWPAAEWGAE